MSNWMLPAADVLAALVVAYFVCGRLARRQYGDWDSGLYVYLGLLAASALLVWGAFKRPPQHWADVLPHLAFAAYCLRRDLRTQPLPPPPQGVSASAVETFLSKGKQDVK